MSKFIDYFIVSFHKLHRLQRLLGAPFVGGDTLII